MTVPKIWVPGEVLTAEDLNANFADISDSVPVRTLVFRSVDQTIANNTATIVSWDAEAYDDADVFASGSPTIFTVPAGMTRLRVAVFVRWAANTTGRRRARIERDTGAGFTSTFPGSSHAEFPPGSSGGSSWFQSTGWIDVTAGDVFRLEVFQTSGGGLNLVAEDT